MALDGLSLWSIVIRKTPPAPASGVLVGRGRSSHLTEQDLLINQFESMASFISG
jgi:hypothetical protein